MKPTEDLIHEHKAIKVMLSIMARIAEDIKNGKDPDPADLENIVDFLKTFADKCHHGKEENVLFPAMVEAGIPKEGGPIGVMLHEHTLGRNFIKGINDANVQLKAGNKEAGPLIAENLSGYIDLLTDHIRKEENVLFPMAERVLNTNRQNEIYGQFEIIEEEVVGHGVHEHFHELLNELKSKYAV